jgi:hypothetical protein
VNGACNSYGRDEKCIQNFSWGNTKGRSQLGDIGIDGRIILKLVLKE